MSNFFPANIWRRSNFEENNHLELRSLLHLVVELQEDVINSG
ncbi:MAG: hypothetical protein R3C26_24135 [Calditrichia bacterium]